MMFCGAEEREGGGEKKRTSVNKQHLNPKVGVADAHEDDVLDSVVELEVVVPDVAHQLLDLCLEGSLICSRGVGLHVLGI